MKRPFILILLFSSPFFLPAQTIHGLWSGTLKNDSTGKIQNFEMGLSEYRGKITGYTYTTFIANDTFYYSIKRIKAERVDGQLVIEDVEMVGNNFPERAAKKVKQTTIFPLIDDTTIDISRGKWSTNQTKTYYSLSGTAALKEDRDEKNSDLIAHLDEMKVKNNIAARKEEKKKEEIAKVIKPEKKQEKKPIPEKNNNNSSVKPEVVKTTAPVIENKKEVAINNSITATPEKEQNNLAKNNTGEVPNNNKQVSQVAVVPENKKEPMVISAPPKDIQQNNAIKQENKPESKKETPVITSTTNNVVVDKKQVVDESTGDIVIKKEIPVQQKQNDQQKPILAVNNQPAKEPVKSESKISAGSVEQKNFNNTSITVSTNQPVIAEKKTVLASKALPQDVGTRKTETIQDVYFKSDSLILSLYDNGIVDGDTVSVFLNGSEIISKQKLKEAATKKTIYITPEMGDNVELVLFAENLGTIPPNTGLLTIRDGDNVYQVRFSADLSKNASIILKRKK